MWIQNGRLIHAQGVTNPCVYSIAKRVILKESERDLGRITLLALFMPRLGNRTEESKRWLKTLRDQLKEYEEIQGLELKLLLSAFPKEVKLMVFTNRGYAFLKDDGSLEVVEGTVASPTYFGLRSIARILIRMGADPSSAIAFAYKTKTMVRYAFVGQFRAQRMPIILTVGSIVKGLLKVFKLNRKEQHEVSRY